MYVSDPIADMLTRIRNAQARFKRVVSFPHSKKKLLIVQLLNKSGFLGAYRVEPLPNSLSGFKQISVLLKYRSTKPVILALKRVSRPGRRVYVRAKSLPNPLNGMGVALISTSQGIMTQKSAKKHNLGGEVLLYAW